MKDSDLELFVTKSLTRQKCLFQLLSASQNDNDNRGINNFKDFKTLFFKFHYSFCCRLYMSKKEFSFTPPVEKMMTRTA